MYTTSTRHMKRVTEKCDAQSLVADSNFFFQYILHDVRTEQDIIFGKSAARPFPYKINNFFICVDTILRLIVHAKKFMRMMSIKYGVEEFYFVESMPFQIPKRKKTYGSYELAKYGFGDKILYNQAGNKLIKLSEFMTDEEVRAYIPYERFIAHRYPYIFYRTLNSRRVCYTYDRKEKTIRKNMFFYLMQVIQSVPFDGEWKYIYEFFLHELGNMPDVSIKKERSAMFEGYGAAELAADISSEEYRCILVAHNIILKTCIYVYGTASKKLYYTPCYKERITNLSDLIDYPFDSDRKYSLSELFDVCLEITENLMLSTDMGNVYNIFNDPEDLYVKNRLSKGYEDFGRTFTNIPLDKGMCIEIMLEFIPKFNDAFDTKIKVGIE